MALLAYEEPEKSPMFHLLSPEYRQNVADGLNRAILGMIFTSHLLTRLIFLCIYVLISSLLLVSSLYGSRPNLTSSLWLMSAHANLPSYSSMERLIQQATVVRQFLHQEAGKVYNHVSSFFC